MIGKYRRSSLYTVLMKHSAFKYGEAIDSAFMAMPTPDKFNCHDLAVKSFESSAVKQKKKGKYKEDVNARDIQSFILDADVARAGAVAAVLLRLAPGDERSLTERVKALNDAIEDLPDVEADRDAFPIVGWEIEPGDVVCFHMLTLHASGGVEGPNRRRVFSVRFMGDDTRHAPRPWKTSPEFPGLVDQLPAGAEMNHPLFPLLA